jgi:dihydrolipoamide dehydrogenase
VVPTAEQFDLVIIGGGPGGYGAALYGAAAGLNVAVVEKDKVGGTCLHRGCIPAKEFLESAAHFRAVAGAKEFGIQTDQPTIDFAVTQARKQKVVDQLTKGLTGLMKSRKITTVAGTGTLVDAHTVKVDDGTELTGDAVILAAGSVPRTIPGFEPDGKVVFTSDEFLDLDRLPSSAAVIGGGAIGCEFASTMADLGVSVTILEGLDKILPGLDNDVANVVVKAFKKRGIDIRTGVEVTGHTPTDGGTAVHLEGADDVEVDAVVVSIGRKPLSEGLGLDGTGVDVDDRGFVLVDEYMRTSLEGVYAVGDLVALGEGIHPQLAHVGFAEGILVIKEILGEDPVPVDYGKVPWCIYCHPEVAFAGHSEQSAKEAGHDVVVSKHQFRGNSRAQIIGETEGLVKIIAEKTADGKAGTILGVHMVGPWVTEQLGQGYLAVNWEATVDEVAQFIQPHPTLSELFGESVLAMTGRGLHG